MPHSPRYFVSLAVMTPNAGANPMGHAFVYFSKEVEAGRVQIIDTYGYYAKPPSSDTSYWGRLIKRILCLNINFTEGYGHYEREEVRYMDKEPLPAVTYVISRSRYIEVRDELRRRMIEEKQVIAELSAELESQGLPKTMFKGKSFYLTDEVMALEAKKASEEGREPRLSLFELRCDFSLSSLGLPQVSLSRSRDCKVMAMNILKRCGVSSEELRKLGEGQTRAALPLNPLFGWFNYDGPKQTLLAHSCGQVSVHHSKKSDRVYSYRAWCTSKKPFSERLCSSFFDKYDEQDVKMYFSLPPQGVMKTDSISDKELRDIRKLFDIDKSVASIIMSLLSKLQYIEYFLMNAKISVEDNVFADRLVERLRGFYQHSFSRAKKYSKDAAYLPKKMAEGKALLRAIEAGFDPYRSHFNIKHDADSWIFSVDDETNEKFCRMYDVESDPMLDLHL